MSNKTLAIIKPDAVKDNHVGEIIMMINKAGFKVKALKMIKIINVINGRHFQHG